MAFLADTTLTSEQDLIDKLVQAGWEYAKEYVSEPRADHDTKYVGVFRKFHTRKFLLYAQRKKQTVVQNHS